ncbi:MAG TPA: EAL domain-containing protein, partial [Thermoanaerobaculia bacterium]|nr:EAL domain-containing protein [Thermoanaerobaculia bacterium]
SESLRVLALDFAFRDTVASGDQPTITSMLSNHGSRVNADVVFLIRLDGLVVADTVGNRFAGRRFPFSDLLGAAEANGEAAGMVSLSSRPHQLVVVPLLAPRPIAWVCAGFKVDETVLADVSRLTAVEVSLWSNTADPPHLLSTLGETAKRALVDSRGAVSRVTDAAPATISLEGEEYATMRKPIRTVDGSEINALLHRAVAASRQPFYTLKIQIFAFSTLALLVATIAAVVFSRAVTRPLRVLADGARRIEKGDYVSPVSVQQGDEIGQLATAFNRMQLAIAGREEQIIHQATHDALTTLPNRTLFIDRLAQAIASARRGETLAGMIMMDLDGFKEVNDTLGPQFGDELLINVGQRLENVLRESDTVARLGGDEFAVQFIAREASHAFDVARRIATVFDTPFLLGGVSVAVKGSMGIALYPQHAEDADTLMKRAEVAMYDAKRTRVPYALYEEERDQHTLRRLTLMTELRQAITRDELELHFQPKVHLGRDRAIHAEALVRWHHPQHGLLRPDEFISLAEQSGNLGALTKWVLRAAIARCAVWRSQGVDVTIAVNLSAVDLFDSELPTYIAGLLSESHLPPTRLVLEITESTIMDDPQFALRVLGELKSRGVTLAVDDFGTGYSSLAYLKRLPVDELKIDKSFISDLGKEASDDLVIVRSIVELGHNMGLTVVAEGVETAECWKILDQLGCDMAQGYLMSRPVPHEQFVEWFWRSPWGINRKDTAALQA